MTERTVPERLYGLPHAEQLYDDPAAVFESEIDPYWDDIDRRPWSIEEWTVKPVIDTVTQSAWILEYIAEQMGDEMTEDGGDDLEKVMKKAEVIEACEELRHAIASKITYFMADELIATHTVTWAEGDDGEPLIDGAPMYVKAGGQESAVTKGAVDDAE